MCKKKKIMKKLLADIKIQQVSFIMLCATHKVSVLLKITRMSKRFLRSIIDFYFFKNLLFFSQHIMMETPRLEEENIIKDVRNQFRLEKLKKETTDTPIRYIRVFFETRKKK